MPLDANRDNVYEFTVQITSSIYIDRIDITVAVQDETDGPTAPELKVALRTPQLTRQLWFHWDAINAESTRLMINTDGASGFVPVEPAPQSVDGGWLTQVALNQYPWQDTQYALEVCKDEDCQLSAPISVQGTIYGHIDYFKHPSPSTDEQLGSNIALSANGSLLAASYQCVNPNDSQCIPEGGSVIAFHCDETTDMFCLQWSRVHIETPVRHDAGDMYGQSIAVNDSGDTIVVGAPGEDGGAIGDRENACDENNSTGNQANFLCKHDAGAVFIHQCIKNENGQCYDWKIPYYLKAPEPDVDDMFGAAVAISGDGLTVAASELKDDIFTDDFNTTTIDCDRFPQLLACAENAGAVFTYQCVKSANGQFCNNWTAPLTVMAPSPQPNDHFGTAIDLNHAGNVLAVGVPGDDETAENSGAVYVFEYVVAQNAEESHRWNQVAYLKSNTIEAEQAFGGQLTLSHDGSLLAVGLPDAGNGGRVELFKCNKTEMTCNNWHYWTTLTAPVPSANDRFGNALSFNGNDDVLSIGVPGEDGGMGASYDNSCDDVTDAPECIINSGAVMAFKCKKNDSNTCIGWQSVPLYIKAPNSGANDHFGSAVSAAASGNRIAISSPQEDGGQDANLLDVCDDAVNDDSCIINSGALYLYQ